MRYNRLRTSLFTDTMYSKIRSKRGNKAAQVFTNDLGWVRVYPMETESSAPEALALLFARDGVPDTMIMDGARAHTMGEFRRRTRQAQCHIKQIEPHSQWSNRAESAIRELKKATIRKMVRTNTPKVLWDDCIELEAMIQSHTANGKFALNGESPETAVTGSTVDISDFCEFEWYQWILFRNTTIAFPEDKLVLGRYLGPSFDIGPVMAAKCLQSNGITMHRTTLRALTDDEMSSPEMMERMKEFTIAIEARLGGGFSKGEAMEDDLETPTPPLYESTEEDSLRTKDDDGTDLPEPLDNYVGMELDLP